MKVQILIIIKYLLIYTETEIKKETLMRLVVNKNFCFDQILVERETFDTLQATL